MIDLQQTSLEHLYILSDAVIRIVKQVKCLLLSNLCENIGKKLIWKFIDINSTQVLNF